MRRTGSADDLLSTQLYEFNIDQKSPMKEKQIGLIKKIGLF